MSDTTSVHSSSTSSRNSSKSRCAHPKVAIVGAGVGGLTLALFLRRIDISPVIYELRDKDAVDGGHITLSPNGLHVLDQLGLYEQLLPYGFSFDELNMISAHSMSKIGSLPTGSVEKYGYSALQIKRQTLRQTLLKAAEAADIDVIFNHKVTAISETNNHVSVGFSSGLSKRYEFVIGADGVHSRVRQLVSSIEPVFTGQMGIGGSCLSKSEISAINGSNAQLPACILNKSCSFTMMPTSTNGQSVSCFATINTNARSDWEELMKDKQEISHLLLNAFDHNSKWPEAVRNICRTSYPAALTVWPYFKMSALSSWKSKTSRVIVIGDAAHVLPANSNQSAGLTLEDAASLAEVFSNLTASRRRSWSDKFAIDLEDWQSTRQTRVAKVQSSCDRSAKHQKASPLKLQQVLREKARQLDFRHKGNQHGLDLVYEHREKGPAFRHVFTSSLLT